MVFSASWFIANDIYIRFAWLNSWNAFDEEGKEHAKSISFNTVLMSSEEINLLIALGSLSYMF